MADTENHTTGEQILKIANRMSLAVQERDVPAARALFAPDATIWHNTDGQDQTVDECLAMYPLLKAAMPRHDMRLVSRRIFPDGYIQQEVMEATLVNGVTLSLPLCSVVSVVAGRIARIEEYMDSAALKPLYDLGR